MPRNALFRNVKGTFTNVSRGSGADLSMRGNGCVAADLNGDGHTDLYVTGAGYDALLWNDGHGHFSEGARAAGDDRLRLAHGRHRRRRQRRRPARRLRLGLRRSERHDRGLRGGLPEQLPGCPRPPLPQPRQRPARPGAVPRGRREAGHRHARRARPRRRLHRRQRRRPPRPLRRERRQPEPALREPADDRRPRLPARGGGGERRARRPERRHGHRRRRLQRRRPSRHPRHELAQAAARRLPE